MNLKMGTGDTPDEGPGQPRETTVVHPAHCTAGPPTEICPQVIAGGDTVGIPAGLGLEAASWAAETSR
jgi:hypothetical protein